MYRICSANEYLVKTGFFVDDMSVSKKAWVFPGQKVRVIAMNPESYKFDLHAMSKERVPFLLPMVFTVGPVDPLRDLEKFKKYARVLSHLAPQQVQKLIEGVVHGDTRVLAAGLSVEEMFSDREIFKTNIHDRVVKELDQMGLHIYNCNIAELADLPGNEYFFNLKQKALTTTGNQARIDIAEAKKNGDIGENERVAESQRTIAEITTRKDIQIAVAKKDAAIGLRENDAEAKKSMANIEAQQQISVAQSKRDSQIGMQTAEALAIQRVAQIEAENQISISQSKRDSQIGMQTAEALAVQEVAKVTAQKQVISNEQLGLIAESELKLASTRLTCAKEQELLSIDRELIPKQKLIEKTTELNLLEQQMKTNALRAELLSQAQVEMEASNTASDAILYRAQREAEAFLAKAQAKAEGIACFTRAGVSEDTVRFYLALEDGLFEKLAIQGASAIQGLAPQMHIWNTGGSDGSSAFDSIRNIASAIPPVIDLIQSQTGIRLPGMTPPSIS